MKKLLPGLALALVAGTAAVVPTVALAPPATAAPGDPGTPSDPVVLFEEDFENGMADGQVKVLGDYVGANGETYTAEGQWADPATQNGFVLDGTSTDADQQAVGNTGGYAQLRGLADSLGQFNGSSPSNLNHAVAAYTAGDPGPGLVEFRTAAPLPLNVDNRFLTFSVNVGVTNCHAAHPLLRFYLDDGTTEIPVTNNAMDPCPNGSRALVSDGSVLFTGSELGIVLRNQQGSGSGNDHAFDDIKVLDATPQLDKAFSRASSAPAATTTLTFTVTNTSELAAKEGWAFTDSLPAGMEIAPTPNFVTDCANGAITGGGAAGDTTVALTGDLTAGQEYCTLSIDVATPGAAVGDTFANGPANVDPAVGINPPGTATLEIVPPQPLIRDCAQPITFDTGNEGWRVATTTGGVTVVTPPAPSGWDATEGNPGGALRTNDLDSNWTEFWSPELLANGYTDDYTDLIGTTLRFDYRNDTGIGYNLYLGLRGTNGDTVWFNFTPQIVNSQAPNRVRVLLDAALGYTGFSGATGVDLSSPAPSATQLEDILASLDRFIISAEGRTGPDITFVDNFGASCDDLGDAPASYGTEGGEAAAHGIVGYDAAAGTADLMLGSRVDSESDGAPGAAADGDDLAGIDDEDALTGAVLVTAGEAPSVEVEVTNDTNGPATLVGWIDLDENGTFDAGERSGVVTIPANAGTGSHTLTFPVATALNDDTYLRLRLFEGDVTGPQPTGAADGGEVEDHLVQAELAALELVKTSALTTDGGTPGVADVGDVITYTFTVSNTGNVPVDDVSIDDPLPGLSAVAPASAATIAPGDDAVFTATYTVTQDDVDNGGQIVNAATANGTGPDGPVTSPGGPPTTTTTPIVDADPDVQVVKSAAITTDEVPLGKADDGDVITYTFTATNHGAATAFNVSVEDPLPGLGTITPASVASLAPGASQEFTATYTVTADDVKAGKIENTASVESTGPTRGGVTPPPVTVSSNTVNTPTGPLGAPSILTKAEKKVELKVGKAGQAKAVALRDSVTVTGLVAGGNAQGTALLYGPVASPSAAMCTPENLAGSVTFTPVDGTVDTPAVKVTKPGYYTWVVSTGADRRNLAASHACGLPSETTLVHRPEVGKVKIETGFSGTASSVQGRKVRPARIAIPALGMKAKLDTVGVRKGSMVIPNNVAKGGWLRQSALPGDLVGSTVIAGHVSDRHDRPGAFGKLRKAKKGQVVKVRAADGTVQKYRIDRVYTQPRKNGFSGAATSTTGAHQLTLVTCTGKVTYRNGRFHYTKNLVVVASPIG
ncbi:DUF7507 domain-containing protein [Nocardioides humi]|uniref:DUF11 domain-containing protein n=1 Tax=Nocardioides humi TaxID=449461 RepID=A0ABN2A5F2_9ACTN|nr:sortase [Nocardioides humi]